MTSEHHLIEQIDRLFVEEDPLSENQRRELEAHLTTCESCRARYNRVTELDRFISGKNLAQPSARELDRVRARIFGDARVQAAAPSLIERIRKFLVAPQGLALATATALTIAAIAVYVPQKSEFRERGASPDARPATLRAFCVDEGQVLRSTRVQPLLRALKLAAGNKGGYRYAFVVGLQADGAPRWYVPRPPEQESARAPSANEGDVPFGTAIRLKVNHQQGPLRIFAMFSDQPIAMTNVEAAIAKAMRDQASIAALDTLPIDNTDAAQRSVLLEVLAP